MIYAALQYAGLLHAVGVVHDSPMRRLSANRYKYPSDSFLTLGFFFQIHHTFLYFIDAALPYYPSTDLKQQHAS
jgi:hypothetical protein